MSDALKNAEDWHKANQSKGSIDLVKRLISEDTTVNKNGTQTPLLITHNEGKIYFQFCGWSLNIYDDGTWCWEDTTGG